MTLETLYGYISPAAALVIGWFLHRSKSRAEIRKVNAESSSLELDNIKSVVDLYKKIAVDLALQVERLTGEVTSLRQENIQLKGEIKKLEKTIVEKLKT